MFRSGVIDIGVLNWFMFRVVVYVLNGWYISKYPCSVLFDG
jgi:hypothetical protein